MAAAFGCAGLVGRAVLAVAARVRRALPEVEAALDHRLAPLVTRLTELAPAGDGSVSIERLRGLLDAARDSVVPTGGILKTLIPAGDRPR